MNNLTGRNVLVTGGAGYIGSHAVVELLDAGCDVTVLDNLSNSSELALDRVKEITGKTMTFRHLDMRQVNDANQESLKTLFREGGFDTVVHFAGLKAVGESREKPVEYYDNNVNGTINLLSLMEEFDVSQLVFSSSATVYGDAQVVPIRENAPVQPTNVYGNTKRINEELIEAAVEAPKSRLKAINLRYFNPIGAHPSGKIGEDPKGIPNNLMPYINQVAVGQREKLGVFGDDYNTPDGTGVRDYVHVVDLAKSHVAAVDRLTEMKAGESLTLNIGTGKGTSVLELVEAYRKESGHPIPYEVQGRRPGDVATLYASPGLAEEQLGWSAEYDIEAMCRDSWNWIRSNPQGYSPDMGLTE